MIMLNAYAYSHFSEVVQLTGTNRRLESLTDIEWVRHDTLIPPSFISSLRQVHGDVNIRILAMSMASK